MTCKAQSFDELFYPIITVALLSKKIIAKECHSLSYNLNKTLSGKIDPCPKYLIASMYIRQTSKYIGRHKYTNSLVNVDSFYMIFTNKTFKIFQLLT